MDEILVLQHMDVLNYIATTCDKDKKDIRGSVREQCKTILRTKTIRAMYANSAFNSCMKTAAWHK